jgi:hypothetical protein
MKIGGAVTVKSKWTSRESLTFSKEHSQVSDVLRISAPEPRVQDFETAMAQTEPFTLVKYVLRLIIDLSASAKCLRGEICWTRLSKVDFSRREIDSSCPVRARSQRNEENLVNLDADLRWRAKNRKGLSFGA